VNNYECRAEISSMMTKMGYTEEDLGRMVKYIAEEAPIIIHFDFTSSINFFIENGSYRNLLETGRGGGSLSQENRTKW
jgi:hypothetical protein